MANDATLPRPYWSYPRTWEMPAGLINSRDLWSPSEWFTATSLSRIYTAVPDRFMDDGVASGLGSLSLSFPCSWNVLSLLRQLLHLPTLLHVLSRLLLSKCAAIAIAKPSSYFGALPPPPPRPADTRPFDHFLAHSLSLFLSLACSFLDLGTYSVKLVSGRHHPIPLRPSFFQP